MKLTDDEIKGLAVRIADECANSQSDMWYGIRKGYEAGYKAAQSKGWTDEDIRNAFLDGTTDKHLTGIEYLQQLKAKRQPPSQSNEFDRHNTEEIPPLNKTP